MNREQEKVIQYLLAENRVLREKLGKGRILLNDEQRRRLAVKGKELGRKALFEFATIVTPDTILRWIANSSPASGTTAAAGRMLDAPAWRRNRSNLSCGLRRRISVGDTTESRVP
jgi:hypothetical protein